MRRQVERIGALAAMVAALAAPASAQVMRQTLDEASAQAIVAGCRANAAENGLGLVIAVYDEGANLKALTRMDDATLRNLDIAQWKGLAAARGQRASAGSAAAVAEGRLNGAFAPSTATYRGAVPIFSEAGTPLGGVGVSGATGEEDEICAIAGIEAAGLLAERPGE